jgi:nucleotide-binding universal stress UspA family protein
MFQRILVPLDGSELSAQALPYAAEMAVRFGAEMFLLRSVPPVSVPAFESGTMADPATAENLLEAVQGQEAQTVRRAENYLKEHAKGLRDQGLKVTNQAIVGPPTPSILDLCRREGVDLVVMATRGRSSLGRALMGSVADQVIRHSGIPVLAVRPRR